MPPVDERSAVARGAFWACAASAGRQVRRTTVRMASPDCMSGDRLAMICSGQGLVAGSNRLMFGLFDVSTVGSGRQLVGPYAPPAFDGYGVPGALKKGWFKRNMSPMCCPS